MNAHGTDACYDQFQDVEETWFRHDQFQDVEETWFRRHRKGGRFNLKVSNERDPIIGDSKKTAFPPDTKKALKQEGEALVASGTQTVKGQRECKNKPKQGMGNDYPLLTGKVGGKKPLYQLLPREVKAALPRFPRNIKEQFHGNSRERPINISASQNDSQKLSFDIVLKENILNKKSKSLHYNILRRARMKLPIYTVMNELLYKINAKQVIVISGGTGCGKTTQVPQIILDDYIMRDKGSDCRILCALTHRMHVKPAAERVAKERNEEMGALSVGYKVGVDRKEIPRGGSIKFCTIGHLLELMNVDPNLSGVSHVILDGVHERDTLTDVVITLLKDLQKKLIHLKLILMSATLNVNDYKQYFNTCSIITIPEGCNFPVEEVYLEDVMEILSVKVYPPSKNWPRRDRKDYNEYIEPYIRSIETGETYSKETIETLRNCESEKINPAFISELITHICQKEKNGGIIVFLPTVDLITELHSSLSSKKELKRSDCVIIQLHSKIPTHHQKAAFKKQPAGVRKIILATSIAEASITFDDVVYVVDSGKMLVLTLNSETKKERGTIEWVSRANARQRFGRVGRVQPGKVYKLYTRGREKAFAEYPNPEILSDSCELQKIVPIIKKMNGPKRDAVPSFMKRLMSPPKFFFLE